MLFNKPVVAPGSVGIGGLSAIVGPPRIEETVVCSLSTGSATARGHVWRWRCERANSRGYDDEKRGK